MKGSMQSKISQLKIGALVEVRSKEEGSADVGRIRYIGPTQFATGEWIGVELEQLGESGNKSL